MVRNAVAASFGVSALIVMDTISSPSLSHRLAFVGFTDTFAVRETQHQLHLSSAKEPSETCTEQPDPTEQQASAQLRAGSSEE